MRDKSGRFVKGFIKPEEWLKKHSKRMSGTQNPFYGKKHSVEVKKIIKEKRALQDMSWRKDWHPPEESIIKNRLAHIGKNTGASNNLWRGGTTSENHKIRNSWEMKLWKQNVFKRDNYTCQKCGVRGGNLEVDHMMPFASFPNLRLEEWNGRVLCIGCHRIISSRKLFGKQLITILETSNVK